MDATIGQGVFFPQSQPRGSRMTTTTHQSPADVVIGIFGGVSATAEALGLRPSTVSCWRLRNGRIPSTKQVDILRAAAKRNLHLTAQDLVLGR